MDRYLTERAASLLGTSPEERISEIKRKHIIEHQRYLKYYTRVQELFDGSPQFGTDGMLIAGPSGMGKSQILYDFYLNNPHFENDDGDIEIPVLYIVMVTDPTPRAVWANIAKTLKIPISETASLVAFRSTATEKLKASKTRMIIIDECQHLDDTTKTIQQSQVLNLIKRLFEEFHIPVVVSGIRRILDAVREDSQLIRRFHPFHTFECWDFSNETRNLIADIESILPLKKSSNLHGTMTTQIILDKTHGITDFMIKFIKKAAIQAIEDGSEQITEKSLWEMDWIIPDQNYETATNRISELFANPR